MKKAKARCTKTAKAVAATKEQKYRTACGNLVVMKKLPSDGSSMMDAIRDEALED